uniref:Protein-serine O-palmitoleoyltransferase porcupine n=1 Tax=Halisarca dujardinii TaxID=2583056 RepID=A0A8F8AQA5_HALDU|nr:porcupine HduPORCN [Halisarca dujardinii]
MSYALSPLTTVFGPFLTYRDHERFLKPAPMSVSWLWHTARCMVLSFVWLCVSVCVSSDIFLAPTWSKWMVAYGSALSFRSSHYFISFLSEGIATAGGLGFSQEQGHWGGLKVVGPLDVEIPRSMGVIANSWNLSMYRFLKYYVFKPSLRYLGRFGAYLMTYFVSSMLHGLNFQLAAVLLSIGVYSYIENVLRRKLSRRLSACVLDRPCRGHCGHSRGKFNLLTLLVNLLFMGLAVFHLAYLGQMFVSDPDSQEFDYQGFSFWHTLRHWYRLDFLSHIVAGGTFLLSLLL